MNKLHEVYRCNVCGNIVQMNHASIGELVCCGQPMELLVENSVDAATEKHVPVVEKTENGFRVNIGSAPHPMEPAHFIEWIEIIADGVSYKKFLRPGEAPEAEFCIEASEITAHEYCNLHGLWKN
ncbi:desulfoferrodoxin [Candidatus Gracilibacteria bacterium]|nr:desulfoferrodoxin [Candidatus Gracilibacteria bacterium]MCF7856672.1 desulfoferrodoxin [Candidatus Gracilibacteria bacterium]MCF7897003.1 desulfoferrodoxin [Candidatus Gracilibacteria bacterium]